MAHPQVVLELNPSANNPRNSEGSMIELRDGRLMFTYSHFYGGSRDDAPAYIAALFSEDRGKTWQDEVVLVPNAWKNVMSVSLLRFQSGELGLFYLERHSLTDMRIVLRKSFDEGSTWSEPVYCMTEAGYYVVNNDRVIQLDCGKLIVPAALHARPGEAWSPAGVVYCFYSDDGGKTWEKSQAVESPNQDLWFQEPGVVPLPDGKLMLWTRTNQGAQYLAFSSDGGRTWTEPEPSALSSPRSPASIKKIPRTDEYLCIYNDHSGRFPFVPEKRTPLVAARSKDGINWYGHKLLEADPDGWYCYTSITFIDDNVFLGYCAGESQVGGLNRLRLKMIPLSWLTED